MSDVHVPPLYEQIDQGTPHYINTRIMLLEQEFQGNAQRLDGARREVSRAKAALRNAEAHARLNASGNSKDIRDAEVLQKTEGQRDAVEFAELALKHTQDLVHEGSKELNALQTRSSNLRSEINVSGRGRP
ncbi:hypothetical protein ACH47B_13065 [Rhodococcus sp. NPDC019627]|uniref:hypothetical protein n=1 Tax=unclassified Rhodococcus (in: high G+C Gram-positive bacteria) TaxID=192944 RepID=UPI0033D5FB20